MIDGLFSLEIGQGPRRVMLHGGPGASHDYLRPQLDAVGGQLLYYDQRGGGRSVREPVGWQGHVADLEAIRAHVSVEKMTLVGYSWGALLALLYALEHPDRVEKLALISPAPAAARERPEMARRLAESQRRPAVEEFAATVDKPGTTMTRRQRFALAVAGWFWDPRRALELTPFMVQQRAEQAVWSSLGDYDLRPRLPSLRLPALVLHGEDDPISVETARATASALGAALRSFPRCGHVPYIEAADDLIFVLRDFLGA